MFHASYGRGCSDAGTPADFDEEKTLCVFSEITDQDLAQVIMLWDRCDISSEKIGVADYVTAARRSPAASIIVGREDRDVVCGAMVGFVGQRGWINDVCVDKVFQRQGFGKAIVFAAENWLRQRGASIIHLTFNESFRNRFRRQIPLALPGNARLERTLNRTSSTVH
jgi:GNAT superfamily N-acetyltransferase